MLPLRRDKTPEEKLKERLKKRELGQTGDVIVQDIIVTQAMYFCGELKKNPKDKSEKKKESNDSIINRILGTIDRITAEAYTFHKANHCVPDPSDPVLYKLLPSHLNYITRVITHEFMFWPLKEKGPISQEYFLELIQRLEERLKTMVPNMHLALGSFPILNARGEVNNVLIYAESGPLPNIHVFAKAIPSRVDPAYLETKTPFFTGAVREEHEAQEDCFEKELCNFKDKIIRAMEAIINFKLFQIREEIEDLDALYKKFRKLTCSYVKYKFDDLINEIGININAFHTESNWKKQETLKNCIIDNFSEYYNKFLSKCTEREAVAISNDSIGMSEYAYGINIICQTAGGIKFQVTGDLCIDIIYQISQKKFFQEYESNCRNAVVPLLVSQFLSAATIDVILPIMFMSDGVIVQSDPRYPGIVTPDAKTEIKVEDMKANMPVPFAYAVNIRRMPPVKLCSSKFGMEILINNELVIQEKANYLLAKKSAGSFFEWPEEKFPSRVSFSERDVPSSLGEEFKEIRYEKEFFSLIRSGILSERDLRLMITEANFLWKNPSDFSHVFKMIKEMGRDFSGLSDTKKSILFHTPYETFKQVIRYKTRRGFFSPGKLPIMDYLSRPPEVREFIQKNCQRRM